MVLAVLLIVELLAAQAAVAELALIYVARGRNLMWSLVGVAIQIGASLVLVPLYGGVGAAAGLAISALFLSIVKSRLLADKLGHPVAGLALVDAGRRRGRFRHRAAGDAHAGAGAAFNRPDRHFGCLWRHHLALRLQGGRSLAVRAPPAQCDDRRRYRANTSRKVQAMFTANRRQLLGGAAALAALPVTARAATAPRDAELNAALQTIFDKLLVRSPEMATLLGADTGANAALAGKWSDITPAGVAEDRRVHAAAKALLATIPRARLQGADINNYDGAVWSFDIAAQGERFDFGQSGTSGSTPYIVSQQNGTYSQAAEFLDTYHRVENAAGADAYMSRLAQVSTNMDEETRRIGADAAEGVIRPISSSPTHWASRRRCAASRRRNPNS